MKIQVNLYVYSVQLKTNSPMSDKYTQFTVPSDLYPCMMYVCMLYSMLYMYVKFYQLINGNASV